ncbi:MAG: septation protein IspZ, partial [Chitinispirillaceae bacterium]|nr:septation protein IspZ [Chitinispirillaceae bacterium]
PLIVFIIVDSVFNNVKVSIISSVLFAAGQLMFFYFKTGNFDWFVLLDVALIIGLGLISIILKNEIFFKVKPAIIEAAAIIFFVVLIVLPDSFLAGYFGRMMPKGMVLRPEGIHIMKNMLIWTCVYISLHIAAVLYTAFYSSRRMWAFVSGPGFYLLFIPLIPIIILKNLRNKKHNQIRNHKTIKN